MLLKDKTVVIFGGSGAIGRAAALAMAKESARIFLAARQADKLEKAAAEIRAAGGSVETLQLDVLDGGQTTAQVANLAGRTGGIDIVVNATGFPHNQGKTLAQLSLAEYHQGFVPFLDAQFTIAQAVAPWMGGEREGVIITTIPPSATMAIPGHLGHIVGCAAMEAFIKALASELGAKKIRVLGVRSHAIADAALAGSYTAEVFAPKAQALGLSVEQWLGGAAHGTMLQRLPTLAQIAGVITFLASPSAAAMTATVVNVTAGATLS
ncbi:TPA: SDR family oxidoreductase [Klebsiella aerogenes]|uniref:SDR family NAD(P)-dependent oxidoreductase n=1 Tax=Klebsiella aerogenes TaxID=548 RepID=UPI00062C6075|nr:SDR family oxidoreductase [Klebsiella aerogenes]ATY03418.1 short-chain dehydrogenase [Klebsiella aerogenes]KKY69491.1 short-chain dehydrogenase [Klebsiella aerogenes]NPD56139.1 SDR family oxidoreductase [Klebsiella aerogenes]WPS48764.1 SDR family oxidoreductase [Klebsiella aerogenes]HBQ1807566.1 SDR family oxidoreductase [Klebsiella aerogenes]